MADEVLCGNYFFIQPVILRSRPWGSRIHRLHLCWGVRPTLNECPEYDPQQFDGETPVMLKQSTCSLPSLSGLLWPEVIAPDRILSMGQIELNCVLMLTRIAWNRTVLAFKLRTYAKLNCLKWNCFCMLNWIVWNRTALTNTILTLNWIVWIKTVCLNWISWNRNVLTIKLCICVELNCLK